MACQPARLGSAALERDVEHPCLGLEPHGYLRLVAPNADRSDVVDADKLDILTEEVFAGLHNHRVARPASEVRKIDLSATIGMGDSPCLDGLHSPEVQAVGERNHVAREAVATNVRALPRRLRIGLGECTCQRSPAFRTAGITATVCADEKEGLGDGIETWIASSREREEIEVHHVAQPPEGRPLDPTLPGT